MYYTENEKIQAGLEAHPKYGRLFVEDKTIAEEQRATDHATGTVATVGESAEEQQGTVKEDNDFVEVKMACNDDAKDYLADKFGVSRSKMRSRADIEKVATDNGVKITWE